MLREPEGPRRNLHGDQQRGAEPLDVQTVKALGETERRDDVQSGGPEGRDQVDGFAGAAGFDQFVAEFVKLLKLASLEGI